MDYKSARRVLVYRIGSLGDTLVALPCFHLIASIFPRAQRVLLTNFSVHAKAPAASAVLGDSGLIHDYMRYVVHTRNPLQLLNVWWRIVRFRPDVLVYLMPERTPPAVKRDTFFFRLAGVRHIVGVPDITQPVRILNEQTGLYQSEAARLAQGLSALGDIETNALQNWDLLLSPAELKTGAELVSRFHDGPLIVCGPGTKWQSKDWGTDNWRILLERLSAKYPGYGLVFVGSKEESDMAETLKSAWSGKTINLCGQISPRETAAVLDYADLFLGPDSGPMHIAALMGVPCAIAFSAQGKPGVWFPVGTNHRIVYHKLDCAGCQLETCIARKKECLTSISVDEMYAAAVACLTARTPQVIRGFMPSPR